MKYLKSIITLLTICLATTFSATEKEPAKETKKLRTEIVTMLGSKIPIVFEKSENIDVSFMINQNNEIVVVSVESEKTEFNSFVKRKLNYKKINVTNTIKNKVYIVPVKVNVNLK
jgi:hypothetical protein|tara:strand:+ start:479 stop:823 length:345 start_codon:yes stop_codon:yes gene_type:complete